VTLAACDLLNNRVLPFDEHLGITVGSVLPTTAANSAASPTAVPGNCP
jgi:hypothetical protein